ncbi:hypothetical protein vec25_25 [Escherichia phage VEc25]|uniref:Uncharacterized protein n=1 Tax=Escherichia phage VEc25 TaxID=2794959 RepID=A0A7T1JPR6_9CAUD|nr:hypothetical protein vec25_25 [Escherichia phage VEc25]
MVPINKKGVTDLLYVAGFNGEEITVYASSLAAAKQKAVEYFRPKKRVAHTIWVHLAEEN